MWNCIHFKFKPCTFVLFVHTMNLGSCNMYALERLRFHFLSYSNKFYAELKCMHFIEYVHYFTVSESDSLLCLWSNGSWKKIYAKKLPNEIVLRFIKFILHTENPKWISVSGGFYSTPNAYYVNGAPWFQCNRTIVKELFIARKNCS